MTALWRRFRSVPSWWVPLAVGLVLLVLPTLGVGFSVSRQIQLACILALVTSGLNLSFGYAGELALGQAAMYAAGAYAAGLVSKMGVTDILVQLVVAGVVALVVGLVTGAPGLRMESWSLAMTSFFLVLLIPDILTIFSDATGGRNGLSGIQPPTLMGLRLDNDLLYLLIVVVTIVWFAVMRNIVESRHGVALRVLRQSPVLASSMGISVYSMKLRAYALGAVPAGLAGALFANLDLYLSPESFGFVVAMTVLAASILGGSASVYGAAVGAIVMQLAQNQSTDLREYSLIFTGVFLIAGGVLLTGGLSRLGRRAVARMDRRAGVTGPQASTDVVALDDLGGGVLEIADVSKAFGGNQALCDVSLVAPSGQVTGLIGPNGSGKTTLLNIVSGFYRLDEGRVTLDDTALHELPSHKVARAGVARTFQTPDIPDDVTVIEAVVSGRFSRQPASVLGAVVRSPHHRAVRDEDIAEGERVLELVGLSELRNEEATALPLGMRRLLEVARALVARPGVLLLDEVASGLDEHELETLSQLIRRIAAAGGTVVLVEHNFQLVLDLADQIYVLAHGEVIAAGPPADIENHPRVMSEYLGVEPEGTAGGTDTTGGAM